MITGVVASDLRQTYLAQVLFLEPLCVVEHLFISDGCVLCAWWHAVFLHCHQDDMQHDGVCTGGGSDPLHLWHMH